jgi:predicted transposase YdaD
MTKVHPEGKDASPRHDPGYKRIFSHRKMVEELIRGFLPGDWIERLDFSTLERMSGSFVSGDLRERHSDLIWRVQLRGDEGGGVYLYLLLEFQSTSDPFMSVRLQTYTALLLEEIIRRENLKPGDRLPAVLPVVLHSGHGRWRAPLRLETHFAPVPKGLRRYLPRLTYLLLDERRLNLDRPELASNPTAAFFQVEVNESAEALFDLHQQLKARIPPGDAQLRRDIDEWFLGVVRRMIPGAIIPEGVNFEESSMLEENLRRWNDEARQEGRREGRQEGQIQARREMLRELMAQRFGRLPVHVRRQIEEISSLQELRRLGRKVLRAKTLQDMGLGQG